MRLISPLVKITANQLASETTGYNLATNQDWLSHGFNVGVNLAF